MPNHTPEEIEDLIEWHRNVLAEIDAAAHEKSQALKQAVRTQCKYVAETGVIGCAFLNMVTDPEVSAVDPQIVRLLTLIGLANLRDEARVYCAKFHEAEAPRIQADTARADQGVPLLSRLFKGSKANLLKEEALANLDAKRVTDYASDALAAARFLSADYKDQLNAKVDRERLAPGQYLEALRHCQVNPDLPDNLSHDFECLSKELLSLKLKAAYVKTHFAMSEKAVLKSSQKFVQEAAQQAIAEKPLSSLSGHVGEYAINRLAACGIKYFADMNEQPLDELAKRSGLPYLTLRKIETHMNRASKKISDSARISLSADSRSEASSEIVMAIFAYLKMTPYNDEISSIDESLFEVATNTSDELDTFKNGINWLLSPEPQKVHYANVYKQGLSLKESASAQDVARCYIEAKALEEQAHDALEESAWAAFIENPILFYTTLEKLCPDLFSAADQSESVVPDELAKEIDDTKYSLDGLNCTLRRYQEDGLKFILHQKRVLLGDEMGLGKTIQAIASMVALRNSGASRFLVICPVSVLPNWCHEISKHSDLHPVKVHGQDKRWSISAWQKEGGVAVTNYESAGAVLDAEQLSIDMLIVDEAHYVKNPSTNRGSKVHKLSDLAPRVLFMTGTALENKVEEMISLVDYLRPDIAQQLNRLNTFSDLSVSQFKKAVADVYYRRKRDDVLSELPELSEHETWCELEPAERRVYEHHVCQKSLHHARRVSWSAPDLEHSAKMNSLKSIVEKATDDGRKVLVFSYYRSTINSVQRALKAYSFPPITGDLSANRRQEVIDEFSQDPSEPVLLCQIEAGGTGLNIQAASVIVICEPQYKPSLEAQAISRAYRMGQARKVLVYRLLAEETIDKSINALRKRKQEVFDSYADGSIAAQHDMVISDSDVQALLEEEAKRIESKQDHDAPSPATAPAVSLEQKSLKQSNTGDGGKGKKAKSPGAAAKMTKPSKTVDFSVAGLNKMNTGELWIDLERPVKVVREPENRHDENAIALHIGKRKAGYIPRKLAVELAPLLDCGYSAEVICNDAGPYYVEKKKWTEYGYEYTGETKMLYSADATIRLYPPPGSVVRQAKERLVPWQETSLKKGRADKVQSKELDRKPAKPAKSPKSKSAKSTEPKKPKHAHPKTDGSRINEKQVVSILREAGHRVIDKRSKGGNLWVLADKSAKPLMNDLAKKGYEFKYKPEGGRATKGNSAWWLMHGPKH